MTSQCNVGWSRSGSRNERALTQKERYGTVAADCASLGYWVPTQSLSVTETQLYDMGSLLLTLHASLVLLGEHDTVPSFLGVLGPEHGGLEVGTGAGAAPVRHPD